jgi:hypothetical protein
MKNTSPMKKNSTNQSVPARRCFREGGFLNLRVLIGLFIIVAGVSLALLATAKPPVASLNQPAQKYNPTGSSIDLSVLPPGFDCSQIHQKGIDRQDNMRAGAIMIACGLAEGGSAPTGGTSGSSIFSKLIDTLLPAPLFIGGGDSDVIFPDSTYPKVTQSESMEWGGPNSCCALPLMTTRPSVQPPIAVAPKE